MKTVTVVILRRFGFRQVMIVNALISSAVLGVYGLFTAQTPHALVIMVLLVGGCLRSLQFTAVGAIAFADISQAWMSQASGLQSMSQRLAQSLGVAFGAYALELSSSLQGHSTIVAADFWPAFLAIALVSGASVFYNVALPHDAGAELSGKVAERKDAGVP